MTVDTGAGGRDAPSQHAGWVDFYEAAWALRADLIEGMIAEGDRHPLRLIRRLAALERGSRLIRDAATGQVTQKKLTFRPGETDLTPTGKPAFARSSLRGKFVVVPFHSAQTPLTNFILDYIEANGPYDALIELGCGYGRNLIELYYGGGPLGIPYLGGELTDAGRALGLRLAGLDPAFPGRFFFFDHTNPNPGPVSGFKRPLVFTIHSLEQVHHLGLSFFEVVSRLAPQVTCLHFEPFGFQLANLGEVSEQHRQFMEKQWWNVNLAAVMTEAATLGLIRLDYVATEIFFSPSPTNPTSLAIWTASSPAGEAPPGP